MKHLEESVEIALRRSTVYNQFTQFESFPTFMQAVEEVRQLDDTHVSWKVALNGLKEAWEAQIDEQFPDTRIVWHSTSGPKHSGAVRFEALDQHRTRVTVAMDYEPEGFLENVGSTFGVVSRKVHDELMRFKDFVEAKGDRAAWRGEIRDGEVVRPEVHWNEPADYH